MTAYQHNEAFCHMTYRSKDGTVERSVWNSRDGVTPFGFFDPAIGVELLHVEWSRDRREPEYVPQVGDLVWIDLNPERALVLANKSVEHWWDDPEYPMRDRFATKTDAARMLVEGYFDHGTPPDLLVVDEQTLPWIREQVAS